MPHAESADVVIIGGGASGLSAAGALTRACCRPVVLDQDDRIGGTWARRYERLHLHTVRAFSGLPYLAMPRELPRYVSKDQFASYLENYARDMGLDVRLGQRVRRIARVGNGWKVDTDRSTWETRVVVLATGRHGEPVMPVWPGQEAFRGSVLHAGEYRTGARFTDQRALVVGIGNSGAEIAADLAEQSAAYVAISVRTRPPIMPRDLFGIVPAQVLGLAFTPVPAPRLLDRAGAVVRRLGSGDLSQYGLGREAWGPFTARRPAVIDVGLLRQLKAGRVHVRPNVSRMTPTGVAFADGTEETFDVVIAATGYRTALDRVLDLPEALTDNGRPRHRSGRDTPFPGLYFIGYDETTRGVLYEANRDARRMARSIARYLEQTR